MKKNLCIILIILGMVVQGQARSSYNSRIPNGNVFSCDNCHTSNPPNLIQFGRDFQSQSNRWTTALSLIDSDGDNYTNGVELLDPTGQWVQGQPNPGNPADVTNPGDRNSFPEEPTTGVIEGYVYDCRLGDPIPQTSVIIEGTDLQTETNNTGYYYLELDVGTYDVRYAHPDYLEWTIEVNVVAGETIDPEICLVTTPIAIFGRVTDAETGLGIADAMVRVSTIIGIGTPSFPALFDSATTDQDGYYSLETLPRDSLHMYVYTPDREFIRQQIYPPDEGELELNFELRFIQSFEASDGGFTANRMWDWGLADGNGGAAEAYMGENYWSTNIDGVYPGNQRAELITPSYNLTLGNIYALNYAHWFETNAGWDGYNLSISTDNGSTWELLTPEYDYPSSAIAGISGQPGFSGQNDEWETVTYDLADYMGNMVQFRFRFGSTNNSNNYRGICIDYFDVELTGIVENVEPVLTGIDVPKALTLDQNIPNPFNPVTKINFAVPQTQKINLSIYTVNGQLVKTLRNGTVEAGSYSVSWNGTDTRGADVASGTYLYRLESGKEVLTRTMVLLK